MTTFFTADPHLGDEGNNVVGRPFASKADMSEEILEQYNSRVTKHDRLIIVGDFAFKKPAKWRQRIVCKNLMLVLGNHDPVAQCEQAFGYNFVREQYVTKCNGHRIYLNHYPTLYWPASHYGSFHGYGHVHGMRTHTIESLFPDIRSIDVGVDEAYVRLGKWTCFSEQEIYDILAPRKGHDPVEFYRELRGECQKDHKEGE